MVAQQQVAAQAAQLTKQTHAMQPDTVTLHQVAQRLDQFMEKEVIHQALAGF